MAKRLRIMMTAIATILICVALIAVGSYALFSDTTKVTTHLKAGDLDIKLWRINLTSTKDSNQTQNADDVNFSSTTTENIFGLTDGDLILPTDKYEAEMMISRSKNTNVGIKYWLDFIVPAVSSAEDQALLEQLKITIEVRKIDGSTYFVSKKLSALGDKPNMTGTGMHYNIGSIDDPCDVIDISDSLTSANIETALGEGEEAIALFKVTVEFEDPDFSLNGNGNIIGSNNNAQDGEVSFDIVVNAVQVG